MERLSSALNRVLRAIEHPQHASQPQPAQQSNQQQLADPQQATISPVKLRWPKQTDQLIDQQSVTRSLMLHDMTMLAVHASVLQHGGRLITSNELPEPNHECNQSYKFVPDDWNANQLSYSLSYLMYAPPAHHERETEHDPGNAEVLTSETPIEYQLNVKAAPLNEFLIITCQMVHNIHNHAHNEHHKSIEQTGIVWPAVKTTVKPSSFVDVNKVVAFLNQSTDQSLGVDVYHGLDKLLAAVSNGLLKRSMGALWTVLVDRNSPAAHYSNPVLSDLPIDVLISALSTLTSLELVRLGQASSSLYDISCLQDLWRLLCQTELRTTRERQDLDPTSWKNEFIIRKQLEKDERERNKYALVPIGQPVTVQREHVFARPVFRANFMNPAINDPLGFADWRRGEFRSFPNNHMPMMS